MLKKFNENWEYDIDSKITKYEGILYHGSFKSDINLDKYVRTGIFLTTDREFASGYGDYLYEIEVKFDKVFNTLNGDTMKSFFEDGTQLTNQYAIDHRNDDKDFDDDDDDDYGTIDSYEDWLEADLGDNTWEAVESNIDAFPSIPILITENGIINYYVENPKDYVVSIKLIK
jgi:hypothetical protein